MLLHEDEDLARAKIPRGQQRLRLAALNKLLKTSADVGCDITQEETGNYRNIARDEI